MIVLALYYVTLTLLVAYAAHRLWLSLLLLGREPAVGRRAWTGELPRVTVQSLWVDGNPSDVAAHIPKTTRTHRQHGKSIPMKMKRGRDVKVAGGVGATPARAAGWAVTR